MIFSRKSRKNPEASATFQNARKTTESILNEEVQWLRSIRSEWKFEDEEIHFQRATLDFLVETKVRQDRQFWVYVNAGFRSEFVAQVPEESIGRNLAEAINLVLKSRFCDKTEGVSINAVATVNKRPSFHCYGDPEYGVSEPYELTLIFVIKPPVGSTFEALLQEVRRYKLAAQG